MQNNSLLKFSKEIVKAALKTGPSSISYYSYFSRWKNSLTGNANSVVDRQPWITFPVIDLLNKKLNNSSVVFEYGGGGSTLFFIDRAGEVITVEHDKEWFNKLDDLIAGEKRRKWKGNFISPETGDGSLKKDPSNPSDYASDDELFKNSTFEAYARKIDSYPDKYFDLVLVDGRSRPSCMQHSISKIKKGGWLIIDNSDREYYFTQLSGVLSSEFIVVYNKTAPCPYLNFFSQTTVLEKK